MAGSFLEITVNDAEISALLQKLQAKLGDLTPVFRDLGEALQVSHRERLTRAVAPDGASWPDLSPKYRARKKKKLTRAQLKEREVRRRLRYITWLSSPKGTPMPPDTDDEAD